jgi:hypothetical protein
MFKEKNNGERRPRAELAPIERFQKLWDAYSPRNGVEFSDNWLGDFVTGTLEQPDGSREDVIIMVQDNRYIRNTGRPRTRHIGLMYSDGRVLALDDTEVRYNYENFEVSNALYILEAVSTE